MKGSSHIQKLRLLGARNKVIRSADAVRVGVSKTALSRLSAAGDLVRVARGFYQIPEVEGYNHPDLLEAALQVPKGVVVLLSALNFHGIGTHPAWEVWMQIPANYPAPRVKHPPLRIVRSRKPEAFKEGVEIHEIAGHHVKITDVDRTIVDCFKHRNQVTLEVCIEALRQRMKDRRHGLDSIHRYADLMGVSKVMRPYMEALA